MGESLLCALSKVSKLERISISRIIYLSMVQNASVRKETRNSLHFIELIFS